MRFEEAKIRIARILEHNPTDHQTSMQVLLEGIQSLERENLALRHALLDTLLPLLLVSKHLGKIGAHSEIMQQAARALERVEEALAKEGG
jgi:type VI protein secretion system component VasF